MIVQVFILHIHAYLISILVTGSSEDIFNLRIWTINGKLIKRVSSKVEIKCLQYTSAPEGVYVNVLVGGLANGNIKYGSHFSVLIFYVHVCENSSCIKFCSKSDFTV